MATAPEAIEFFMALFCNTSRIVLLMETVPWKLLVQVSPLGQVLYRFGGSRQLSPPVVCMCV